MHTGPDDRPATFNDYIDALTDACADHPEWREGQAAFNALYVMRPALAEAIRGNAVVDPFHNDDNLSAFYGHVRNNWDAAPDPVAAADAASREGWFVTLDEALQRVDGGRR